MIRNLICTFVGHVDAGKTSIQDYIRGTSIAKTEPGLITQKIYSTIIDSERVKELCKGLLKKELKIPGFIFLDTPGHASFTNLRKRGGNLADIAVLVIDINEGIKPQTLEAIEILKHYKTPFVIAANKIDLLYGFRKNRDLLLENINSQQEFVKEELDRKLYEIVGKLSEINLPAERFDRIDDYTKQIALIPCSVKLGIGITELLLVLIGLAQRYLEKELEIDINKPGKGTILEIREEKGKGKILDSIVFNGSIKLNDILVIGGVEKAIVVKVKNLFIKNKTISKVSAASNVKINAIGLDEVFAGMPFVVASKDLEKAKKEIQKEVEEVLIETDREGIILKADSLGSLEALISLLKEKSIKIKKASIGDIAKKDIAEALSEKNHLNKVILGFNVKELEHNKKVKIINYDIIYKIIDDYEAWLGKEKKSLDDQEIKKIVRPCKIYLMPGYVFRQSNPAVLGVEVISGTLKPGMPVMKDGKEITQVKSIQDQGKNISEAGKGKQVAVSFLNVTIGRQLNSGEILYSNVSEEDFRNLKKLKKYLTNDELETIKEIAVIKRKENPLWGV